MNKNTKVSERASFFNSKLLILFFWLMLFAIFFYLPPWVYARITQFMRQDEKVLYVYAFTESIPREHLHAFEAQTGIRVYLNYFQTNEELFAKLSISKGAGYDVVVCSDYMIEYFIKHQLLKKLDHEQIASFSDLDTRLLHHYFDPESNYSVPVAWTFYGLGINKAYFKDGYPQASWRTIFTEPPYKITVPDDVREVSFIAGLYLFNETQEFTPLQLDQMKKLLIKQKKWIDSYSTDKIEYDLTGGNVPLVVSYASYLKRMMYNSDAFDFLLPSEGSILVIEHLAIPAKAEHVNAAYAFINFLLSPIINAKTSMHFGYNPVNAKSYAYLDKKFLDNPNFFPRDAVVKKMHILSNKIAPKALEDLWLAVKTA